MFGLGSYDLLVDDRRLDVVRRSAPGEEEPLPKAGYEHSCQHDGDGLWSIVDSD